jgi:hypothetical protein
MATRASDPFFIQQRKGRKGKELLGTLFCEWECLNWTKGSLQREEESCGKFLEGFCCARRGRKGRCTYTMLQPNEMQLSTSEAHTRASLCVMAGVQSPMSRSRGQGAGGWWTQEVQPLHGAGAMVCRARPKRANLLPAYGGSNVRAGKEGWNGLTRGDKEEAVPWWMNGWMEDCTGLLDSP